VNPYLFGCFVLLGIWALCLLAVHLGKGSGALREFWWSSLTCLLLGVTEPLFVHEYWSPPSILSVGRWDLESFLFCFAIGGITAALPELPAAEELFHEASFRLWSLQQRITGAVMGWLCPAPPGSSGDTAPHSELRLTKRELTQDNMILAAAFMGTFGATSQLHVNIIYASSLTCFVMAGFIGWRRPNLRWRILAGGFNFTLVYAVVLEVVWIYDHDFFTKYWNWPQLSKISILHAPVEEYLFALTLGLSWAPLYHAWKDARLAAA
jgi:hypothetical protein